MTGQNINRWVGTANLTRDPEIKVTEGGTKIANMRIAVNTRVKRGEEWVDKANYFDLVTFGNKVDAIQRFLHKGSAIAIDGRLDYQEWKNDADETRSRVQIIADSVQFTDGRPIEDGEPAAAAPSAAGAGDDDIPF